MSCPHCVSDRGVCSASIVGRLAAVHLCSSISAKADMMNRKITGERLSPCLTPTDCWISVFSLPIFSVTLRSE